MCMLLRTRAYIKLDCFTHVVLTYKLGLSLFYWFKRVKSRPRLCLLFFEWLLRGVIDKAGRRYAGYERDALYAKIELWMIYEFYKFKILNCNIDRVWNTIHVYLCLLWVRCECLYDIPLSLIVSHAHGLFVNIQYTLFIWTRLLNQRNILNRTDWSVKQCCFLHDAGEIEDQIAPQIPAIFGVPLAAWEERFLGGRESKTEELREA